MRRFASEQGGFGLVELLIAMTVMTIGIMAIVAGFSSGIVALNRASRASTAGTLADKQMEAYRALPYKQIALRKSEVDVAATPYASDTAYTGTTMLTGVLLTSNPVAYDGSFCTTGSTPVTCKPVQTQAGPDGRSYRIDSYISWYCAVGTLSNPAAANPDCGSLSRPVKKVTVVVRDGTTTSKTYVRETSTFDQST
jgi:prepilin-type N-terminal cleavage/methylation domain-containing protein